MKMKRSEGGTPPAAGALTGSLAAGYRPADVDMEEVTAGLRIDPRNYSYMVSPSRWASFKYALSGWLHMLRYQRNTRIQAVASVLVVLAGLWLGLTPLEWAILVLTITLEWMAEFINAAIESAVNLASAEMHPMAKVSKDVAAAAVLLGAVSAVIVGVLLLGPRLLVRIAGG